MWATALALIFGFHETSDFGVEALQLGWTNVRTRLPHVKRLVIYLDNGPKNSGRRTKFLKRMVPFADWSGREIHLVYDPPDHRKYNRIERCWSSLENKWSGTLLTCWDVVLGCAPRMTWKGEHPDISRLDGHYANGMIVPKAEMKTYAARLERSATLPKYDIIIKPQSAPPSVN